MADKLTDVASILPYLRKKRSNGIMFFIIRFLPMYLYILLMIAIPLIMLIGIIYSFINPIFSIHFHAWIEATLSLIGVIVFICMSFYESTNKIRGKEIDLVIIAKFFGIFLFGMSIFLLNINEIFLLNIQLFGESLAVVFLVAIFGLACLVTIVNLAINIYPRKDVVILFLLSFLSDLFLFTSYNAFIINDRTLIVYICFALLCLISENFLKVEKIERLLKKPVVFDFCSKLLKKLQLKLKKHGFRYKKINFDIKAKNIIINIILVLSCCAAIVTLGTRWFEGQDFNNFIIVFSSIIGGSLTLGGVAWSIKKQDDIRREDKIAEAKPYVFVNNSIEKVCTNETIEFVKDVASNFTDGVSQDEITYENLNVLYDKQNNSDLYQIKNFTICNSDNSIIKLKGLFESGKIHEFNYSRVLAKNSSCFFGFLSYLFFSGNQPVDFYIIIEDIYGNEYFLELIFEKTEGKKEKIRLVDESKLEEFSVEYFALRNVGKTIEKKDFTRGNKYKLQ